VWIIAYIAVSYAWAILFAIIVKRCSGVSPEAHKEYEENRVFVAILVLVAPLATPVMLSMLVRETLIARRRND